MDQFSTVQTAAASALIGELESTVLSAGPSPLPPRTLRGFNPGCIGDGMLEAATGLGPIPGPGGHRTIIGLGCISDGMLEAAAELNAGPPQPYVPRTSIR